MTTETIRLEADDGHELSAYYVRPGEPSQRRGGVIVLQEIFGVNRHIRDVTDGFAASGYFAIAPALYDRSSRRDVELDYTGEDVQLGRELREEFSWDDTMRDIDAARSLLAAEGVKVGTVGYCWGGSISFLAATRLEIAAGVVYYGGQILPYVKETERCPLLMHFGKKDQSIPLESVDTIRRAHPEAVVHLYDADHGFNCNLRASYDETAAGLARERTLAFFEQHLK